MSMHAPARSRVVVALLAAATALAVILPAGAVAAAHTTITSRPAAVSVATYQTSVRTLTNAERHRRSLGSLAVGPCVTKYAVAWAKHMAKTRVLVHQNLQPIMKACRLAWVGENIAYGYQTPKAVVAAWMKSPGHRENILRKQFTRIGVGAAKDKNGVYWVSQVFSRPR